jgi:hypothetical protein
VGGEKKGSLGSCLPQRRLRNPDPPARLSYTHLHHRRLLLHSSRIRHYVDWWAHEASAAGGRGNASVLSLVSTLPVNPSHHPLRALNGSNKHASSSRLSGVSKRSSVVFRWRATKIPAPIASTRFRPFTIAQSCYSFAKSVRLRSVAICYRLIAW